jgi:sigma-B regulation protein RsbU (phosphoserine phosphatase)
LFMALTSSLIRTYATEYDSQPERVLRETNRRILEDTHTDLFVTVFYAILDPTTGTLLFSNAGHNPPYHFQPDVAAINTFTKPGIPVGMFEDSIWEMGAINLAPNDVLVLYTDGVTDAQNDQDEFFDTNRLVSTINSNLGRSAEMIQEAILQEIHQYVGGVPQFDDITLVVLVRESD